MKRKRQIFTQVDNQSYAKLEALAESKGLKVSQTARLIILEFLNPKKVKA